MNCAKALAAFLLLLASTVSAASAEAPAWPGKTGRYVFEVTRNGDSIGTQVVEIKQQGNSVIATTETGSPRIARAM